VCFRLRWFDICGEIFLFGRKIKIKCFVEDFGLEIRCRIVGLDVDRYICLGAAICHVSAVLVCESVDRSVFIVLFDGKLNDVDLYEGIYGVEDSCQVVVEAYR